MVKQPQGVLFLVALTLIVNVLRLTIIGFLMRKFLEVSFSVLTADLFLTLL